MEVEFVLSIGSNLGDKVENLNKAIEQLSKSFGKPRSISSFYQGEPWGFESENDFVNCCVKFRSNLSCQNVLKISQSVEKGLGRMTKAGTEYESRIIDVDIIFFGKELIDTPELTIPHRFFQDRKFVLIPLKEIENNWIDPRSGLTIDQLIENCQDESKLTII